MTDTSRNIQRLAAQLISGELTPEQFQRELQAISHVELPEATLDLQRADRCGFPEVIFAPGKPLSVLVDIIGNLSDRQIPILATRVESAAAETIRQSYPDLRYHPVGRTLRSRQTCLEWQTSGRQPTGKVVVVSAGTSDLAVAEEACETLAWMGVPFCTVRDVGVAGPQRLLQHIETLRAAAAIVVVAGMEGALPSVVGGHVGCPVFAVPTSVGYGTNFGGMTALFAMLNSCAANVAVCNIDAGFKAAYLAGLVTCPLPAIRTDERARAGSDANR